MVTENVDLVSCLSYSIRFLSMWCAACTVFPSRTKGIQVFIFQDTWEGKKYVTTANDFLQACQTIMLINYSQEHKYE